MNRYRITEADEVFAAEFKRNLEADNWFHSPGLQRVLNAMRSGPGPGKYVLVVDEPFQRWRLGTMPAKRGDPIEIVLGHQFHSLKEAEWTVFELRWQEHTGETLSL